MAFKKTERLLQENQSHQTQKSNQISQKFQPWSVLKNFLIYISTKMIQNGKVIISKEILETTPKSTPARIRQSKLEAVEVKNSTPKINQNKSTTQMLFLSVELVTILCKPDLGMMMRCMAMKERTICKAGMAMTSYTEELIMTRSEDVVETTRLTEVKAKTRYSAMEVQIPSMAELEMTSSMLVKVMISFLVRMVMT